jgi:hypothetical protein
MGFIIIPDKLQAISVLHREENIGFCFPHEAQRDILFSTKLNAKHFHSQVCGAN